MLSLDDKWNQKICWIWRKCTKPKTPLPMPLASGLGQAELHFTSSQRRTGHATLLHCTVSDTYANYPSKAFSLLPWNKHLKWPEAHQNWRTLLFSSTLGQRPSLFHDILLVRQAHSTVQKDSTPQDSALITRLTASLGWSEDTVKFSSETSSLSRNNASFSKKGQKERSQEHANTQKHKQAGTLCYSATVWALSPTRIKF